jgi:sugar phosphate isomerase/epimerase
MSCSRRDFAKAVLTSIPATSALLAGEALAAQSSAAQSESTSTRMQGCTAGDFNSKIAGVQIGVIVPYSYHGLPGDAESILASLIENGINGCEMQSETAEPYAGAPEQPNVFQMLAARGIRGGNVAQLSPEDQAKVKSAAEALEKWRQAAPMSKFEALHAMYAKAGVRIYGFKLQLEPGMPDWEFDYAFNVAKTLGADQLTMEMPMRDANGTPVRGDQLPRNSNAKRDDDLTARIGKFADKHRMMVGYHAHLDATPTFWDVPMSQSQHNGINIDVGHYVAAGNRDVVEFIRKNHARITSIHVKDRKYDGGPNEMWGQGDTPLDQIFALMRDEHYTFPASIELEYKIPDGSNSAIEIGRCVAWSKDVLVRPHPFGKSA